MTSPRVVVRERSQIYGMWAYPWVVSPSNLSLYGMWAYPCVVSPRNLSLFWDDRLVCETREKRIFSENERIGNSYRDSTDKTLDFSLDLG